MSKFEQVEQRAGEVKVGQLRMSNLKNNNNKTKNRTNKMKKASDIYEIHQAYQYMHNGINKRRGDRKREKNIYII